MCQRKPHLQTKAVEEANANIFYSHNCRSRAPFLQAPPSIILARFGCGGRYIAKSLRRQCLAETKEKTGEFKRFLKYIVNAEGRDKNCR